MVVFGRWVRWAWNRNPAVAVEMAQRVRSRSLDIGLRQRAPAIKYLGLQSDSAPTVAPVPEQREFLVVLVVLVFPWR